MRMEIMTGSPKLLLKWFILFGLFMGLCLTCGVVVIAGRIISSAVIGFVSSVHTHIFDSLYSGDSDTRLGVLRGLLTQLKQGSDEQPTHPIDSQVTVWLLPALEQCKGDCDPTVVELAYQVIGILKKYTSPPLE